MKKLTAENAIEFAKKNISDEVLITETKKSHGMQKLRLRAITKQDRVIARKLEDAPGVTLTKYNLELSGQGLYSFRITYDRREK